MNKYRIIIFLGIVTVWLSVFLTSPAQALETRWQSADYIQARLLSGPRPAGKQRKLKAAFDLRLSEGWHAYWRMPGEGGLPPRFDWEGSENVENIDIIWPLPQRFETYGFYSFGYKNAVLLPLDIEITATQEPVILNLKAEIMVCNNICVPQKIALNLKIPAGETENSALIPRREEALKNVPHKGDLPSLKIENVAIGAESLVVTVFSQKGFKHIDLFVEAGDLYVTALPEITIDKKDSRRAVIRIKAPEGTENLAKYAMGKSITLTLTNGRYAIEKTTRF